MRIIQKILSYGLLITFMVAVFMMFQSREQLFPQWFAKEKSSPVVRNSTTATTATATKITTANNTSKISRAEPVKKAAPKKMENAVKSVQTSAEKEESVAIQKAPIEDAESDEKEIVEKSSSVGEVSTIEQSEAVAEPEQKSVVVEKVVVASERKESSPDANYYRPLDVEKSVVEPEKVVETEIKIEAGKAGSKTNEATKLIGKVNPESPILNSDPVQPQQDNALVAKVESAAEEAPAPLSVAEVISPAEKTAEEPASSSAEAIAKKDSKDTIDTQAIQKSLDNARSLYWKRDVEAAVFAYQQVVTTDPTHAQAWGELGNLYFNHGRWPEAADSYYQAGMLLVDQGDPERASQILRVLHGLDAVKGEKLQKRLGLSGK